MILINRLLVLTSIFACAFNLAKGNDSVSDSIIFRKELRHFIKSEQHDSVLQAYIEYSLPLIKQNCWFKAEVVLLEAIEYIEENQLFILPYVPRIYGYLAYSYYFQQKYAQSVKLNEIAYSHLENREEYPLMRIKVIRLIALGYYKTANTTRALESFELLLRQDSTLVESTMPRSTIYLMLGILNYRCYDLEQARIYLGRAEKLMHASQDNSEIYNLYLAQGNLYLLRKEFSKARNYFLKIISCAQSTNSNCKSLLADAYNNLGVMYEFQADYPNALKVYKMALMQADTFYTINHLNTILNMGLCYAFLSEWDSAWVYNQKAKSFLQKQANNDPYLEFLVQHNLAYCQLLKGNPKEALAFLENDFGDDENRENSFLSSHFTVTPKERLPQLLKSTLLKAEIYWRIYKTNNQTKTLKISASTYNSALEILEYMRNNFITEYSKLLLQENFLTRVKKSFKIFCILYELEAGVDDEELFAFGEKLKSPVLTSLTYLKPNQINSSEFEQMISISDSLQVRQAMLKDHFNIHRVDSHASSEETKEDANTQLSLINNQGLHQDTTRKLDSIPKLQSKVELHPTLSDVQKLLNPSTLILNYFISDDDLFVMTISAREFSINRLASVMTIEECVMQYLESLRKYDFEDQSRFSESLYKYVIKPIESIISNYSHLLIVPDGFLFHLPFESLHPPSGSYVIEKHSVSHQHSPTFWYHSQKRSQKDDAMMLNFLGCAPFVPDISEASVSTRALPSELILKASNDELLEIQNILSAKTMNTKLLLGDLCTKENFLHLIKTANLLHIASHTTVNENVSYQSGILLYPDRYDLQTAKGKPERSQCDVLMVDEISELSLDDMKLVVLSACETGIGKSISGEGMLSLNRAFLSANAQNVLYSLWKIMDKPTHTFMTKYYANLVKNNYNCTKALQLTKLEFIYSEGYFPPSFWAGYQIVGVD